MCTGCSLCWDFCPRGGLRYETLWPPSTPLDGDDEVAPTELRADSSDTYWKITGAPPADGLGAVLEGYAVRSSARNDDAQDGGAVTALLTALLATGEIDGALVSKPSDDPDEPWKGVATIATTPAELRGRVRQLLQPDDGPRRARPLPVPAARQAPHRRRRHAVRGPGPPGHAGPALADRCAPRRRGRPLHRPLVHQELRLRGVDPERARAPSGASTSTGSARSTSSAAG